MLLEALVSTSGRVAATSQRNAKRDLLAQCLAQLTGPEVRIGVAYLAGELPQGRIGVGYSTVHALLSEPMTTTLQPVDLLHVDAVFEEVRTSAGAGSAGKKKALLGALLSSISPEARAFLGGLLAGGVRQGALSALMLEAVAQVKALPPALVRRAAMLAGSEVEAATVALNEGAEGLARYALVPFRPVLPMLASPIGDATEAAELLGAARYELKLDGARLQAHKDGDEVRLYSRSLHDVTSRAPEVVAAVRALPVRRAILDGEALVLRADGSPQSFQVSQRRFGRTNDVEALRAEFPLTAFFFDLLLADDDVLLDAPLHTRSDRLNALLPAPMQLSSITTADAEEAEAFYAATVAAGHEGVMVKSLDSLYDAGRRGEAWLKLKPAHTVDLVVLAVEHGSGRRSEWLSNIHLGARDGDGFAMVGKTFKGMTDAMLTWQTQRFAQLATNDVSAWTVELKPEQVVEVAFNDVLRSSEYSSGVALRFARVRRYRDDKPVNDIATLTELKKLVK